MAARRFWLAFLLLFSISPIAPIAPVFAERQTKGLAKDLLQDRIGPLDVISISIFPGEEYSREVTVQPDGTIAMPLIGVLQVQGLSVSELEILVQKKYSKYVSNPQVTANVKRFSGRKIAIIGEVLKPGYYDYRDGMRLLELVSTAGGLTQDARASRVIVLRPGEKESRSFSVDFSTVLAGDVTRDPLLAPGDTIHVPKQPFTTGAAWVNRNILPWALVTSMIASVIVATRR